MSAFTRADLDQLLSLADGAERSVSDEQFAAVSASPDAPAVVVAAAGTGKTAVMAMRVAWLIANGVVEPAQVLGLTFSRLAASELAERIDKFLRLLRAERADLGIPDESEPVVQTYHGFAATVLGEFGLRGGLESGLRVINEAESAPFVLEVVRDSEALVGADTGSGPVQVAGMVSALDSALADAAVATAVLRAFDDRAARGAEEHRLDLQAQGGRTKGQQDELAKIQRVSELRCRLSVVVDEVRAERLARGVVTYADLTRMCGDLLTGPAGAAIADQLRARFPAVLLDEYQDTSTAQAQTLSAMFGGGHGITAVGDPFQLIYEWRGAALGNMDRFGERFGTGGKGSVETMSLALNRRSRPPILEAANRVAEDLRGQTGSGVLLKAADNSDDDSGEPAVVTELFELQRDETEHVVSRVRESLDRVVGGERIRGKDVAVLLRTWAPADAIIDALAQSGIKARRMGKTGLTSVPAVAELVALLQVVDEPTANTQAVQVLAGPRFAIGPRDLLLISEHSRRVAHARGITVQDSASVRRAEATEPDSAETAGTAGSVDPLTDSLRDAVAHVEASDVHSITEAVLDIAARSRSTRPGAESTSPEAWQRMSPEAIARCQEFADELDELRSHLGEPLFDFVSRVVRAAGLDQQARVNATSSSEDLEGLAGFSSVVAEFSAAVQAPSLSGLLAWLESASRADEEVQLDLPAPDPDTVRVMTVHGSKGLQFDSVIMPCVVEGIFPTAWSGSWLTDSKTVPRPLTGDAGEHIGAEPNWREPKFWEGVKAGERALHGQAELRLAYVGMTRAKRRLFLSGHVWPSAGQARSEASFLAKSVAEVPDDWPEFPDSSGRKKDNNPHAQEAAAVPWPAPDSQASLQARRLAAQVRAVADAEAAMRQADEQLNESERALFASLDADARALVAEATATDEELLVGLPVSLSVSAVARFRRDPEAFALWLRRPMPAPSSPAARIGTAFHEWVERRFQQRPLIEEFPGAADADWEDAASADDLAALQQNFEASEFADRHPHAQEEPVSLVLAGAPVVGRIDAVFELSGDADTAGTGIRWEVVDWKTGSEAGADPTQLAVYRLAWAQRMGVPVEQVGAAFFFVSSGVVKRFDAAELPDRAELERLISTGQ